MQTNVNITSNHSWSTIESLLKLLNVNETEAEIIRKLLDQGMNATMVEPVKCPECDWKIGQLAQSYAENYHAYLAIAVCLFGTIANIINISVLTRKEMYCTPINKILTGLAVADMMVMIEYNVFAYYYYFEHPQQMIFPYWGAVFMLFHTHFSQVFHTISICLTLTLAIWRYLAIG